MEVKFEDYLREDSLSSAGVYDTEIKRSFVVWLSVSAVFIIPYLRACT